MRDTTRLLPQLMHSACCEPTSTVADRDGRTTPSSMSANPIKGPTVLLLLPQAVAQPLPHTVPLLPPPPVLLPLPLLPPPPVLLPLPLQNM